MRNPPKALERALLPFAIAMAAASAASALAIAHRGAWGWIPALLAFVYLLPPLLWRAVAARYPLREGVSAIGVKAAEGSSWLVAHRLQLFYITFPILERALMLAPGAYSAWLRLWGSRVGPRVYWTPGVQVTDRTSLDAGELAFFGNNAYLSAHAVMRLRGQLSVCHRRIRVGRRAFVGFNSVVCLGARIEDGVSVAAGSSIYPDSLVTAENAASFRRPRFADLPETLGGARP